LTLAQQLFRSGTARPRMLAGFPGRVSNSEPQRQL